MARSDQPLAAKNGPPGRCRRERPFLEFLGENAQLFAAREATMTMRSDVKERGVPDLVTSHHVVAPDPSGQGASEVTDGRLDADRMIAWLGELIERICSSSPALVGFALDGAIAARFAGARVERVSRLVLVDTLGLAPFDSAPGLRARLHDFPAQPTERTHDILWRHCAPIWLRGSKTGG
jgi:pimeloyl-ACP methyl ester carboxylesterase